jgi:hypothetical protein
VGDRQTLGPVTESLRYGPTMESCTSVDYSGDIRGYSIQFFILVAAVFGDTVMGLPFVQGANLSSCSSTL